MKTKVVLFSFLLVAALPARGTAQDASIGHVERIAARKGVLSDTTSLARLFHTSGRSEPVRTAVPLFTRDLLRLYQSNVFLDLRFQRPDLESRAVLGTTRRLEEAGIYEIRDTTIAELNRLQLVLRQGALVIEQIQGDLDVVAVGIRAQILGTTVLFQVDSTGSQGVAFMLEGHMRYPDFQIDVEGRNRAWRLQRGQPPVPIVLAGNELREWQREVKYNTSSVWRRTPPWWQRPGFLIPAAAVAVGAGVLLLRPGGDTETARGTVIIVLPN